MREYDGGPMAAADELRSSVDELNSGQQEPARSAHRWCKPLFQVCRYYGLSVAEEEITLVEQTEKVFPSNQERLVRRALNIDSYAHQVMAVGSNVQMNSRVEP